MRTTRLLAPALTVLLLVLGLCGCGDKAEPSAGAATQKEAIEKYCVDKSIDIPDLSVSGEKAVSQKDPAWEVDYAFPADAEGEGLFFLLHKTDGGWTIVAHTAEAGWSAAELEALGAPTDIVIDPSK